MPMRTSHRGLRLAVLFLILSICGSFFKQVAGDDSTTAITTTSTTTTTSTSSNGEEPNNPVCRMIPKNSLAFCSMVDYVAVVDEDDEDGAKFDARAKFYYENVDVVLQRFGCHARYSLYKCDDCREAYKYWICSIKFQKCGQRPALASGNNGDEEVYEPGICTSSSNAATATCESGVTGRHRTCVSLCEDVVRKCPYVLNFQCPTADTVFFSADIMTCNKMDRTKNPDHPDQPWPGTFADS